jgi:hypothetical protein
MAQCAFSIPRPNGELWYCSRSANHAEPDHLFEVHSKRESVTVIDHKYVRQQEKFNRRLERELMAIARDRANVLREAGRLVKAEWITEAREAKEWKRGWNSACVSLSQKLYAEAREEERRLRSVLAETRAEQSATAPDSASPGISAERDAEPGEETDPR